MTKRDSTRDRVRNRKSEGRETKSNRERQKNRKSQSRDRETAMEKDECFPFGNRVAPEGGM